MALSLYVSVAGCGGGLTESRAEGMHDVLDVVTDVVEPAKELAEASCETAEALIEMRAEADHKDHSGEIQAVRMRCDRVTFAFHLARTSQMKARALIDQARELGGEERVKQALVAIDELQRAVKHAFDTWNAERLAILSGVQ